MDRKKKLRAPIRAQLTRLVTESDNALQQNPLDKVLLCGKLQAIMHQFGKLAEVNQQIMDALLDDGTEGEIEEEYARQAEYEEKYFVIKTKIESVLTPVVEPRSPVSSVTGSEGQYRNYRLPKIELRKFSGELTDWLSFWAQFKKIDEDPNIDGSDKFDYLLQCMTKGTDAHELVSGYPSMTAENYVVAVEALKQRYGNEDLLLQVYVRKLLKLVVTNATSKDKVPFEKLYVKLDTHLRALKSLKLEKADPATWLYPLVESSLPEETLLTWQRSSESSVDGSQEDPPRTRLDILMGFLNKEVQIKQRMKLAREGFQDHAKPAGKQEKIVQREMHARSQVLDQELEGDIPTAMGLVSIDVKNGCGFCGNAHPTQDCLKCRNWTLEERTRRIMSSRRCLICLKAGHFARSCTDSISCDICGGRHFAVLCQDSNAKGNENWRVQTDGSESPRITVPSCESSGKDAKDLKTSCASHSVDSDVLLPVLMVNVNGPNGNSKKVRVGIDTFSQHSYIKRTVAQELGYKPLSCASMSHAVFGGKIEEKLHFEYEIQLSSVLSEFGCQMQVYDDDLITVGVPARIPGVAAREMEEKGLRTTDGYCSSGGIEILIGSDYAGEILTGKTIQLKCGPTAIETKFGWVLMGRLILPEGGTGFVKLSQGAVRTTTMATVALRKGKKGYEPKYTGWRNRKEKDKIDESKRKKEREWQRRRDEEDRESDWWRGPPHAPIHIEWTSDEDSN